jgi:hypothetical protein
VTPMTIEPATHTRTCGRPLECDSSHVPFASRRFT